MEKTEQVLVVGREALEKRLKGRVFTREGLEELRDFLAAKHFFLPRPQAEYDSTVKQIIPYVIIRRKGAYFLLRRLKKQTEARLHDKLSLGIGGHINPVDEDAGDPIQAGLYRELSEEVEITHILSLTCVGLLNETTGGVSDYHAGLVYLLETDGTVTVRETEKMSGEWVSPERLREVFPFLESWSQIAARELILAEPK